MPFVVTAQELIEFCELEARPDIRTETGYRRDTRCEGRAVFDAESVGGKEVRYSLSAHWVDALPVLYGIGYNPSKARATKGDRTVNRVIRAARDTGRYGGLFWINLAAQMETNAKTFIAEGEATGRLNQAQLERVLERFHPQEESRDVLLAWGGDGPQMRRWLSTVPRDPRIRFLTFGTTARGRPRHPSRLRRLTGFELEQ